MSSQQQPQASLWGWFSREGRLKNRWASALADADPASSLVRLRQIQESLLADQAAFSHLWLVFVDCLLETSRLPVLTEADLSALEKMVATLAGGSTDLSTVWLRLVAARDQRDEDRAARALLTQAFLAPSTSPEGKARCARELARRGARGDAQISVYVEHLQAAPDHAAETVVLNLLANICSVDFETDPVRLKRAGEVAARLQSLVEQHPLAFPWLARTLGLHVLLVEENPASASRHFDAALQAGDHDRVVLIGLICAAVRDGRYDQVAQFNGQLGQTGDPIIGGLLKLSATLRWQEQREIEGPVPATVQQLAALDLQKYVGDVASLVIGRLHLLEGNSRAAAELLLPLAERHPEQPRWSYYAVWAALLVGDRAAAGRRLAALDTWSGRWSVACLLLDSDVSLADRFDGLTAEVDLPKAYALRHSPAARPPNHQATGIEVPPAYATAAGARVDLARSVPPRRVTSKFGAGSLEEDLEALRASLAVALFRRERAPLEQAISLPLFGRLPLADQVTWRGLAELLTGSVSQGRALLEDAVVKFGYRRAALPLVVHLLEQNQFSSAEQFLERAAGGHTSARIELLRAYIDRGLGRYEAATERLERLVAEGQPRAHYALGCLYLDQAEQAGSAGRPDRLRFYGEQAVGAFSTAIERGAASLPTDVEALLRGARLLANPTEAGVSLAGFWRQVERLDAAHRPPWLVWHAALAQCCMTNDSPAEVLAAAVEAVALLEDVEQVPDSCAVALAQALARACASAATVGQANELAQLVGRLAKRTQLEQVRGHHRLATAAAALRRYDQAGAPERGPARQQLDRLAAVDAGNGGLALVSALAALEGGDQAAASATLRQARPTDDLSQRLLSVLADLLAAQRPAPTELPAVMPGARSELTLALTLLGAAVACAAGQAEQSYEALLSALHQDAAETARVVEIERFLPALCAQSTRTGAVPPPLLEVVRQMAPVNGDSGQALIVARCAVAIGEVDLALQAWQRAIQHEDNPASPLRQEFAALLCYLAVAAHRSGNDLAAAERLRLAASLSE